MSLKDRVASGVESLFNRLNEGDDVSGVAPAELERELTARVAARKAAGDPSPRKNKKAALAGAGEKAKTTRMAHAAKRVKRIHAQRAKKAAQAKREQDAAFQDMAEEARRNPPPRDPQPRRTSGSRSSGRTSSRRPSIFQNRDMADHYKTLGVEYGADSSTVKKAYRKLMRKYHPDLHSDAKKKAAATKLTVKISAAYAEIEKSGK